MKNCILIFVFVQLVLVAYSKTNYPELPFNPLVLDLGNDTTVCSGESFLLDSGPGYDSYLWQDGSTEQTFLVTEAGIYWVHVWQGTTMYTDTIAISYWTEPDPDLGADTVLCYGESLVLEPGVGFAYYMWMDGSNLPFYVATQSGVYWVTVTDENGCIGSDTIVIDNSANMVDLGNDTIICECGSLFLDAGEGFISYYWQDGSTEQYYLVDGNELGVGSFDFFCTVIDTINCESSDTILVVIDEHTDISSYYYDKIRIYPNPNDGEFFIKVSKIPSGLYYFTLTDSFGRTLKSEKLPIHNQQEIFMDVSYLSEGIYYLNLSGNNITVNKKLLIR